MTPLKWWSLTDGRGSSLPVFASLHLLLIVGHCLLFCSTFVGLAPLLSIAVIFGFGFGGSGLEELGGNFAARSSCRLHLNLLTYVLVILRGLLLR